MKNYKYIASDGIMFSEKRDIERLEKAALNGWHLKKMTWFGSYKLEKGEKQELSYAIDNKKISQKSADFQEYIDIFKSGGWKYVCSLEDEFHFFVAPKGSTPIYTDSISEASKYWTNSIASIKAICITQIIAVALFLSSYYLFKDSLLGNVLYVMGGALVGVGIAHIVSFLINIFRTLKTKYVDSNNNYSKMVIRLSNLVIGIFVISIIAVPLLLLTNILSDSQIKFMLYVSGFALLGMGIMSVLSFLINLFSKNR